MRKALFLTILGAAAAWAWQSSLKLDHLDRLTSKATDRVNITLDGSLLRMAAGFVSNDNEDSAEIKKLISGLKGIYIRSFEFKEAGTYLDSDVEAIRSQLRGPQWSRIVETHSKTEGDADVYLRTDAGHVQGITVIAAEPRELTIVNIEGAIDLDGLRKLSGNFGIPKSLDKKLDEGSKPPEKNK